MNSAERALAAGFLNCMMKQAKDDKSYYDLAADNPLISGLIGSGLGAGVGGLGSYLASKGMYEDEPDPARAAKKRNRNLLLGILGGGAIGGAAGVAPGILRKTQEEMDQGGGILPGAGQFLKNWGLTLGGTGAGGYLGRKAGLSFADKEVRKQVHNAISQAIGDVANQKPEAAKALAAKLGISPVVIDNLISGTTPYTDVKDMLTRAAESKITPLSGDELRNVLPLEMQQKLPNRWYYGGAGGVGGAAAGALLGSVAQSTIADLLGE